MKSNEQCIITTNVPLVQVLMIPWLCLKSQYSISALLHITHSALICRLQEYQMLVLSSLAVLSFELPANQHHVGMKSLFTAHYNPNEYTDGFRNDAL